MRPVSNTMRRRIRGVNAANDLVGHAPDTSIFSATSLA